MKILFLQYVVVFSRISEKYYNICYSVFFPSIIKNIIVHCENIIRKERKKDRWVEVILGIR